MDRGCRFGTPSNGIALVQSVVVVPKMLEDEGIFFYAGACDSKRQYQGEDVCTASGLCPGATSDFCVGLCDDTTSAVEYQTCVDQCVFVCAHVPVSEDSSGVSSAALAGTQFATLHVHRFEISLFLFSLSLSRFLALSLSQVLLLVLCVELACFLVHFCIYKSRKILVRITLNNESKFCVPGATVGMVSWSLGLIS